MEMTRRARSARQLASLLTDVSGSVVRVIYDRDIHRHRVVWTNGPDVAQMYTLAMRHAESIRGLDHTMLVWDRDTTAVPAR